LIVTACAGSESRPGTAGAAGASGSAGNGAGSAGASGAAGVGSGAAGKGAAGNGGAAGMTGVAGNGGSTGRAGTSGSAGTVGAAGSGGAAGNGGKAGTSGAAGVMGAAGTSGAAGAGSATGAGGSLGAFPGLTLGPVSNGGTLTFQMIGAAGKYPSRRDPAVGPCDVPLDPDDPSDDKCCFTNHVLSGTQLTPWDEELSATLRGPMLVKQMAVYQPVTGLTGPWQLVSSWDARTPTAGKNIAFSGAATPGASGFAGVVGNKCLVDVSTAKDFPCGAGSVPYCPAPGAGQHKYYGWAGSKLYIWLATMPHYGSGDITSAQNCNNSTADNWYDAPWIGISHGEIVRQGLYNGCHCYSYPGMPNSGNGCGQLNAYEVVNDNNTSKNLDVISTNFFGYGGYVGEGPCGTGCNVSALSPAVDLVNKKNGGNMEAAMGAISTPKMGPGAAFRRPATGYRYIIVLFDVNTRTVQQAFIHPSNVPASLAGLFPSLPAQVPQSTIDALVALRLPH
jgi:hypothetical protein